MFFTVRAAEALEPLAIFLFLVAAWLNEYNIKMKSCYFKWIPLYTREAAHKLPGNALGGILANGILVLIKEDCL